MWCQSKYIPYVYISEAPLDQILTKFLVAKCKTKMQGSLTPQILQLTSDCLDVLTECGSTWAFTSAILLKQHLAIRL